MQAVACRLMSGGGAAALVRMVHWLGMLAQQASGK
jgi:hypothetical protein